MSKGLDGSEVPSDFLEPKAFIRTNDRDWRVEQSRNASADATQRSIAISLKRIADALENGPQGWQSVIAQTLVVGQSEISGADRC